VACPANEADDTAIHFGDQEFAFVEAIYIRLTGMKTHFQPDGAAPNVALNLCNS